MRVVLINPAYQRDIEAVAQTTLAPPMGLLYLAASLERAGHTVAIVDANAHGWSVAEVIRRVAERDADLIGLTATTPTVGRAGRIAVGLRAAGYGGLLMLGGPHVTALPTKTLQHHPAFDAAALGEAEETIVEVAAAIEQGRDLREIAGLAVRTDDGIVRTPPRAGAPDIDALPRPARHLLQPPHDHIAAYNSPDGKSFAVVVASRGCPAPCTYCNVPGMFGKRIRRRDPADVADEVAELVATGVRFVDFIDDTFTWSRRWVLELCGELRKRALHERVSWLCLTRVDRVTPDLLEAMSGAGCKRIEMGIECASTHGLDALHKGIDEKQVAAAFAAARAAGLETLAFAMVNVPGEGRADIALTERLLHRVDPDYLQLTICTPYPGTPLYERALADGRLRTRDFDDFRFLRAVVLDNGVLSPAEVRYLHKAVQRRFWMRPRRVGMMLKRLALSPGGGKATLRMAGKALEHLF